MKKTLLSALTLFLTTIIYSQQMPDMEAESDWLVSSKLGFLTLEVEGAHKSTVFATIGSVGKEFVLFDNTFLFTGLEHLVIQRDLQTSEESIHQTYNFLQLPVGISSFLGDKNKTAAYVGVGVYASYLLRVKSENVALQIDTRETGLGFNFGAMAQIGVSHVITDKLRVRIGLATQSDFAQSYKKDVPKVILTSGLFFEFGFGVQL